MPTRCLFNGIIKQRPLRGASIMLIYTIHLNESQTLYFLTFEEFVAYKKEHKIYPYGFSENLN